MQMRLSKREDVSNVQLMADHTFRKFLLTIYSTSIRPFWILRPPPMSFRLYAITSDLFLSSQRPRHTVSGSTSPGQNLTIHQTAHTQQASFFILTTMIRQWFM